MAGFNHAEEDIENDCILVQTDCTFNIALAVLKSLNNDEIQVCSYKVVTINNIESNDPHDHYSLRFGGGGGLHLQSFARTTSSVLRMMALESVNASRWCPRMGRHSERRNRQKMQVQTFVQSGHGEFVIAATKSAAEEYYTYYDHLHPHFKIENGFSSVQPDDWSMQNMMLIFRHDFTEVIEIGTSLQVGHRPHIWPGPGTFHSNAHVHCIVRHISNPNHDGLKFLRALKNISGYREEFLTLAGLLDQIAQQLPSRQEEEDDHSDESEEDAQTLMSEVQVNHQLHVVPVPQRIQMPPPPPVPQMQVNHHQPRAAPALPQALVNNHLSVAPVPQQMPPQVQVSNHQPRAAPAPQKMIPSPQVKKLHAALVPQQMPPQVHVGNQPRAALATLLKQIPQVLVNHHLGDAPVPQQIPPPTPQMQGNHQLRAAPAPQKSIPPPEVKELHAASEPQRMPVQVHATLVPQARRGDCGD